MVSGSTPPTPRSLVYGALVLVQIFFGLHYLAAKSVLREIPPGAWVLMRSDWSKRQGHDAFLNAGEDGPHSPGPHPDCVRFMVERDVLGFGTECVGTDAGQAANGPTPFPCHYHLHGNSRFGLPSLTNLDQLPPQGAVIITPPLKIRQGSGSPVRVLALVESRAAGS